jgi:hypothetical protein
MKYLSRLLFVALLFAAAGKACADSIVLNWNASTSANVAGYNVYYGTNSGNYIYKLDAGNSTSTTISNLSCGVTYYFAATAYDGNGDESGLCPEVSFVVPGILCIAQGSSAGGSTGNPATLTFPVAPGHWYEVQATTDLQNWTSIWQSDVMVSNVWTQFTDPAAASFASRFYRLVAH